MFILSKLKIQLLSLGILSGNDYSANVQQIGIGKVFTFLKNINDPTVAATVAATATAPEIVLYYEQLHACIVTFALQVFHRLQETALTEGDLNSYNDRVTSCDTIYSQLVLARSNLLARHHVVRTDDRPLDQLRKLDIWSRSNSKELALKDRIRFSPISLKISSIFKFRSVAPAKEDTIKEDDSRFISINRFTLLNNVDIDPASVPTTTTTTPDYDSELTETAIVRNMDPEMLLNATKKTVQQWLTDGRRGIQKVLFSNFYLEIIWVEISSVLILISI